MKGRKAVVWGGMNTRCWGIALVDFNPLVGFKIGLTYSWSRHLIEFNLILICLRVTAGFHLVDPRTFREEEY